jgi:hypothetical protein
MIVAGRNQDNLTEEEIERRATDALRRALTTPYKPQKEMIGRTERSSPKKAAAKRKTPAKR